MRTALTSLAVGVAVVVPAAAAEAREPVTRAAAATAAHRIANQAAAGVEELANGAASVERTSVGNYLRYGKFRMSASFAVFGTITVDGQARMFWCVGSVEVVRTGSGRTRVVPGNVTCPS
jgi:hypothetical protein